MFTGALLTGIVS